MPIAFASAKSGQEFTSSQPRLLKSIDKVSGQKPRRGEQASDEEKAAFTDVLPVAATAIRDFPSGDTLSIFTEIYDRQLATPHSVGIKTTVTGDDGSVLFSTSDTRKSEEIGGKAGGYGHTQKVSLTGYKPGRYVLRVEAASSLSNGGSASRELEFRIR